MQVHDRLDFHGTHQPDAEFAICSGRRMTYGEARDASNRVAHALIAAGLEPGDRIATIMKNSVATALLYLGAFKAGVVPAPINFRLMPSQWQEFCDDAEVKLLVCDAQTAEKVNAFGSRLTTVRQFVVENGRCPGWTNFEDWIAQKSVAPPHVSITEDNDALQIYTSGTTGKPRGVVLTHRAICSCVAQLELVMQFHPSDRFLLIMPLFHAAGIIVMLHAISGGASLLLQSGFVPADVVEALDTQQVSVAMLVPTMIQTCLNEVSNIEDRKFEHLRLIIYGASPIKVEMLREAMRVFGCDFAQRYGSTETLCLTWLNPEEHRLALSEKPELLHSAGRPLPGVQIRVVDANLREVPCGERGEFIASGPGLMSRYWKLDGAASFDLDGVRWLHTGDAGFKDSDDYFYICDRVNDVINSGGENIYPQEIEEVLLEHPDICDAAVIGVPDAKWGEAVKAIVVPRSGASVSAEQLISHCRERLAGFKTPHSFDIASAIPRNPAGKVLRTILREPFWKGHPRRV